MPAINKAIMCEFEEQFREEKLAKATSPKNGNTAGNNAQEKAPIVLPSSGGTQNKVRQEVRRAEMKQDERTYVHLCWIYMWCGTLWQQDKKE